MKFSVTFIGLLIGVIVESKDSASKTIIRARRQFACAPPLYCAPVLQAQPGCVCTNIQQDPCCQTLYQPVLPIPAIPAPAPIQAAPACICTPVAAPSCCPPPTYQQPIIPQQNPCVCVPPAPIPLADPCCQPQIPQQNPVPPQPNPCCCCNSVQQTPIPPPQFQPPPQDSPLSCTCVQVTIKQAQAPAPQPQLQPPIPQQENPCVCVPVQQTPPCCVPTGNAATPPIYQNPTACCQPQIPQQNPIPPQNPVPQQNPCVCVSVNRDPCCQPGFSQTYNIPAPLPSGNGQFEGQNNFAPIPEPKPINSQYGQFAPPQVNGLPNVQFGQQNNGQQGQFGNNQQPQRSSSFYDPSLNNPSYGNGARNSPTPAPQQRIQTLQYPPQTSTQRPFGYNPQQQSQNQGFGSSGQSQQSNHPQSNFQRPFGYQGQNQYPQQRFSSPYQQSLPELRPSVRRQPPSMTQAIANCACQQQKPCKC